MNSALGTLKLGVCRISIYHLSIYRESEFQAGDTDFGGSQHVCDNWSQVVEWSFLEREEYIARRKEDKNKTQMDIKIYYVGRRRRNLEWDLEEVYGWQGNYNVIDLKKKPFKYEQMFNVAQMLRTNLRNALKFVPWT